MKNVVFSVITWLAIVLPFSFFVGSFVYDNLIAVLIGVLVGNLAFVISYYWWYCK